MATGLRLISGIPRMQDVSVVPGDIYDETTLMGAPVTAGVSITLPASETYEDKELKIELNGQLLEAVIDYNYVGSIPRTQIQMTFDLVVGDRLRFKKGD